MLAGRARGRRNLAALRCCLAPDWPPAAEGADEAASPRNPREQLCEQASQYPSNFVEGSDGLDELTGSDHCSETEHSAGGVGLRH